jgi:LAS superfamily LD-carboxypeptidase LdcB
MADKRWNPTTGLRPTLSLAGILLFSIFILASCQSADKARPLTKPLLVENAQPIETPQKIEPAPPKNISSMQDTSRRLSPTFRPSPSPTVLSTATSEASPTAFSTPFPTETAVPLVSCDERMAGNDLFTIVTLEYGLSRDFAPGDLNPIADHLPISVTLGYPTEVRRAMLDPLVEMINDMLSAGLQPQILSGYRSYPAQAIAWDKWSTLYPDHAAIISAPPGHSEHQLGTVIDFGSPELPGIVGEPDIQFHTYFYKTSEGKWLAENAYKYGFTLSYPSEAFETTGFYYEPWHYRYVGQEMAQQLYEQELTLTEFQLAEEAPPCLP